MNGRNRNTLTVEAEEALPLREAEMARQSRDALAGFVGPAEGPMRLRLQDRRTGAEVETTIPQAAVRLLAEALSQMAEGRSLTLVTREAELSTQQAADVLGVSRPYLVKLLESGQVPYRKVGAQRRVRSLDLLAYVQDYQRQASPALDALAAEARRLGLPQ